MIVIQPSSRFNRQIIGYVCGLLLPIAVLVGQWLFLQRQISLVTFIKVAYLRGSLASVLSLCLVPNLLSFFIFIWLNWLKSAQGVLGSTIFLSLLIFGIKFCM